MAREPFDEGRLRGVPGREEEMQHNRAPPRGGDGSERAESSRVKLSVVLPARPEHVLTARHALDGLLADDRHTLEDVRLVLSELVTNCIRHGRLPRDEPIEVQATVWPDRVRLEVFDHGVGFRNQPRPAASPAMIGGWGLVVVDGVAQRWGAELGSPTLVWAEIDRRAAISRRLGRVR